MLGNPSDFGWLRKKINAVNVIIRRVNNMNSIYDSNGRVAGFKCFECGKIVSTMWGEICNLCRAKQERHNETINEIKKLRQEITKLKDGK